METVYARIQTAFPNWNPSDADRACIESAGQKKITALLRAVEVEAAGRRSHDLREEYFSDFNQFDFQLNAVMSSILSSDIPLDPVLDQHAGLLFPRNFSREEREKAELTAKGYARSSQSLSNEQMAGILAAISQTHFKTRVREGNRTAGAELLASLDNPGTMADLARHGDTYWAEDLNQLTRLEWFQKLAFDPYILSTAARYLGCCPIHVQTNVWFSFPTKADRKNLSENAQMFHQDKEFLKFIKVFIYLSDVDMDRGPHCYVEGSHVDEAISYGVPFSARLSDAEATRIYGADRIKQVVGPAGSIVFGDTSCLHKGTPLKSGYRLMLQLEYASSLYCSPVTPFDDLQMDRINQIPGSAKYRARLTKNYDSEARADFMHHFKSREAARPRGLNKFLKSIRKRIRAGFSR